jgi:TPP-dependent pyruvate/acetoin dehydrogenase alpha subunit
VTAQNADTGAAWENPLMPNDRLRQIYLAMMQARALVRAVPTRRAVRSTLGLEACLVSPAVDLGPGDLVSDVLAGSVMDFLRGVSAIGKKKHALKADCGDAATLPGSIGSSERIWTAVGAAAALQSLVKRATSKDEATAQAGVVVLYLVPGEFPSALLQKVFAFARKQSLPLVFVVLPTAKAPASAKAERLSDLALRSGVPAIPTDAADAVAIYRVAQESIGHARIGGGPAVVECVQFVPAGKRIPAADAISGLEQYMLPRKVVTQAWLDRESKRFTQKIAKGKNASK